MGARYAARMPGTNLRDAGNVALQEGDILVHHCRRTPFVKLAARGPGLPSSKFLSAGCRVQVAEKILSMDR